MGSGLWAYILRRLFWAVPVLFVISFTVFAIIRLAPGDPVDTILGQRYDEDVAARLRDKYGYDEPIFIQYGIYLRNLARLDLGESTQHTNFSVGEFIWPKLKVTIAMNTVALILTFAIGIPIGVYAALARGTFLDPLVIGFWLALDAVPVIVWAPIVQYVLALKLGLVGLTYEGLWSINMVPAVLVMALPGVAGIARFMRASIVSVVHEDYVRTARAKGLSEWTVVVSHITRNALLPMVTVVGLSLPGIASGSFFVEALFGIPGIARAALEAVTGPDYDVILALTLMGSTLFVLANILIDVTYAFLDPRIKVGQAR